MTHLETRELSTTELDQVSGGDFFDFISKAALAFEMAQGMKKTIDNGVVQHVGDVVKQVGDIIKNTPH